MHFLITLRIALDGTGDNQRCTRLVDQHAINLVDDGEEMTALYAILRRNRHVVAQVVETEFVIGAVGDVAGVLRATFAEIHVMLDAADGETEELVDFPHPFRVAESEIVVDGHQVNPLADQRIQIDRHGCHQRLALAGRHLGDFAQMQRDTADKLHVIGHHLPTQIKSTDIPGSPAQASASFFTHGERFRQDFVQIVVDLGAEVFLIGFLIPLLLLG